MTNYTLQNGFNDRDHLSNGTNGYTTNENANVSPDILESIAIIGFSCRFPQDATSPDGLWDILIARRNTMTDWPADRLNVDAFYHPDTSRKETFAVRGGHFLSGNIAAFDAPFFSISAKEASAMDPQHRGMLETAYRALENAGIPLEKALGSKTSVHTGCFSDDYKVIGEKDPETFSTYAATGLEACMLANRISWFFNFTGASANIDSACSSSLMALDIACQGLRSKDVNMALVGGANSLISPGMFMSLTNMNMLSPDSLSYSFDERANGYARGEGWGVLVLKRVADAVRDGDTIRAVIRSSGSNQDGKTPGITQPNPLTQECLIRDTYSKAELDPSLTRYVEAHGTGTALGDPLEIRAISNVFSEESNGKSIYIGAVKSNFGHLEGASGIAGIIKTVLILEKAIIPPNANFEKVNPKVDANKSKHIQFPTEAVVWPSQGLRRASVNSFGFGGSNSHVVLDDAYHYLASRGLKGAHCSIQNPPSHFYCSPIQTSVHIDGHQHAVEIKNSVERFPPPILLVFSSSDEQGIERIRLAYEKYFQRVRQDHETSEDFLRNMAHTLAARRSSLAWKSFIVVESLDAAIPLKCSSPVLSEARRRVALVFTGQGAQHPGMASELMLYPIFKNSILRSEQYLMDIGCSWSLTEELFKPKSKSRIHRPEFSQPLCTALQVALIDLFKFVGLAPSLVVGHSSGEIAAAYCAGALSHHSACRVAYFRGILSEALSLSASFRGAMMAVALSKADILEYISPEMDVAVACINSPLSITVSGSEDAIVVLEDRLRGKGIFCRKLQVNVAYHSHQMQIIASAYLEELQNLTSGSECNTQMISSVTGEILPKDELLNGQYWVDNMVSPVQFHNAVARAVSGSYKMRRNGKKIPTAQGVNAFLEVGPHSALKSPIREIFSTLPNSSELFYFSSLVRGRPAVENLLHAVGELYCLGNEIDIDKLNQATAFKPAALLTSAPEYPFNHAQTYWHESRRSMHGHRLRKLLPSDLLGIPHMDWNPQEARWRLWIRASQLPWIQDHVIDGVALYPAAGMIVMAIEGLRQLHGNKRISGYNLRDVAFSEPLLVRLDADGVETEIHIRSLGQLSDRKGGWLEFRIFSFQTSNPIEHCRGSIQPEYDVQAGQDDSIGNTNAKNRFLRYSALLEEAMKRRNRKISTQCLYENLEACGYQYKGPFQALKNVEGNDLMEAIADVEVFQWKAVDHANHGQPHVIHPTTLDATAQLALAALTNCASRTIPTAVPTRISKAWISDSGLSCFEAESLRAFSRAVLKGTRTAESRTIMFNDSVNQVLGVINMETTNIAGQGRAELSEPSHTSLLQPDVDLIDIEGLKTLCPASSDIRLEIFDFFDSAVIAQLLFVRSTLDELNIEGAVAISPEFSAYVDWMRSYLENAMSIDEVNNLIRKKFGSREDLFKHLMQHHQLGSLFIDIGLNLSAILNGRIDPIQLLDFNNRKSIVEEVFQPTRKCYESMQAYLELLIFKIGGMRILVIGSGDGAAISPILSCINNLQLPGVTKVISCDLSGVPEDFIKEASNKYTALDGILRYREVDTSNDALNQGSDLNSYDLVIASSALSRTKHLGRALANLRKLLREGGKLVVSEPMDYTEYLNFTLGLLNPNWWTYEDDRKQGPYISRTQWDQLLRLSEFSGVDLKIPDLSDGNGHNASIIISTACSFKPTSIPESNPEVTIVFEGCSAAQHGFARALSKDLDYHGFDRCKIASLSDVTREPGMIMPVCIFLSDLPTALLESLDAKTFDQLKILFANARKMLWVSVQDRQRQNPLGGMMDGFARILRSEYDKLDLVTLVLESSFQHNKRNMETILKVLQRSLISSNVQLEIEYEEHDGIIQIRRLQHEDSMTACVNATHGKQHAQVLHRSLGKDRPLAMTIRTPGLFSTIEWIEDQDYELPLSDYDVEIQVQATGINFRDCLTMLGQLDSHVLGGECAGFITRVGKAVQDTFKAGDRVVACAVHTFRRFARTRAECVVKLPESISFTRASSIPVTYSTAHYTLIVLGRLQKSETVLIHLGAGATGQAAIQIAQNIGATVYTTVGSPAKKAFLMETYNIPEENILHSRTFDTHSAEELIAKTNGRGIDVVLNSLSGPALLASWECVASFGRFIEIGKKDIFDRSKLPMHQFDRNVSFFTFDASLVIVERPAITQYSLQTVIDMLAKGTLKFPEPTTVYGVGDVEKAFRHFQSGKVIGKLVIDMRPDDIVPTRIDVSQKCKLDSNATYVIAGGLGGIGRTVARWMASRGARHLILLSRQGPKTDEAQKLLHDLEEQDIEVKAPPCDITVPSSLLEVVETCARTMPPIQGCIQSTMVLRDSIFENMTFEQWQASITPKVTGSWNLHCLLPSDLDFFILLSSVQGIGGMPSQSNYAAGNTYQDALAHHRVASGQRAASLDLGWMASEGVVAENKAVERRLASLGCYIPIRTEEFLSLLDQCCSGGPTSAQAQIIMGLDTPARMRNRGLEPPEWMHRRTFCCLAGNGLMGLSQDGEGKRITSYRSQLVDAQSLTDATQVISKALANKVAHILSISENSIVKSKPLYEHGVDSLLAIELRKWVSTELGADIAIFDIMGDASCDILSARIASQSKFYNASQHQAGHLTELAENH